jgi:hypothetical protein
MVIRTKKKRGGQQGNQNARKHGFYSSTRSPDEICRLRDILAQESIDPEIAVLRVKLQSMVQRSPDYRTLQEASRLIVKWSVKKYHLDRTGRSFMKTAVDAVLEHYSGMSLRASVKPLKTTQMLKKRINLEQT